MIYLNLFEEYSEEFLKWWKYLQPYVIDFLLIILVIFIARRLSKPLTNGVRKACTKAGIDKGVTSFFCSVVGLTTAICAILIILSIVGVSSATIATAVASCSLAVGLALQGTLQNFAGGVLILINKPFVVGDYIKVDKYEGTVVSIDICYTKIKTYDNQLIVLPNGALSNTNLVNVFREKLRRVDIQLPISYSDDIRAVRNMIYGVLAEMEELDANKPKEVIVDSFGDSAINIIVRVWCKSQDYWPVRHDLTERIRYGMDENGFTIPFNQVDVTIKNEQN